MNKVSFKLLCLVLSFFHTVVDCGEVSYDEFGLGNFSMDYPWASINRPYPKPESPEKIGTKLYCYTRDSIENSYKVTLRPEISLGGCPFSTNRPTVFIAHGFFNNADLPWVIDLKNAYLSAADANLFVVDWSGGALMLNYFQASSNTRVVGAEIARVIKYLQSQYGLEGSNVHLIGHSMGAQVMGYVGKRVPGLFRITGLDPARIGFEEFDVPVRLDKSDASYVEMIHTNGMPQVGIGYVHPHGHVDFYMNGGQIQPLCEASDINTEVKNFHDMQTFGLNVGQSVPVCSHLRAYKYFTDVLRPNCTLWGRKTSVKNTSLGGVTGGFYNSLVPDKTECDIESCLPMGLETPKYKARGVFLVNTPKTAPFCDNPKSNEKVVLEMSKNSTSGNKNPASGSSGEAKGIFKQLQDLGNAVGTKISKFIKTQMKGFF